MTESASIYHITSGAEAVAAAERGQYVPAEFDADGFIHCSYVHQLVDVANCRFRGRDDVVVLEVDRTAVGADVKDENLEGGAELFPHIYGALPMEAVVRVHEFPCGAGGDFELPGGLRG